MRTLSKKIRVPKVGDRIKILPSHVYPEKLWGKIGTVTIADSVSFRFDVINQWGNHCHIGVRDVDYYEFADQQLLLPFGADHV